LTGLTGTGSRDQHPFENPGVVFCFPGQGVQTVDMGRQLYASERVFRHYLDACDQKLRPLLGSSLLSVMYPAAATEQAREEAAARLNQTLFAQPAIFAFEYALAQLWLSWGIQPAALVGHSVGEYVAACLAGVFSLDDALLLISVRCKLMQALPRGGMLAVRTGEQTVLDRLPAELDLAAANSPQLSVVSGPEAAIDRFAATLDADKILNRRLVTSHAFHSRMVDPVLAPFGEAVRKVNFAAPSIPYVSTLTGEWMTAEVAAQPEYWTRQLRQTVRFGSAIATLIRTPERILLEVGPAETLGQIMRQVAQSAASEASGEKRSRSDKSDRPIILSTLSSRPKANKTDTTAPVNDQPKDEGPNEDRALATALGNLWVAGVTPDWQVFHAGYTRRRVLLPTYPFDRKRYWVEPPPRHDSAAIRTTVAVSPVPVSPITATLTAPAIAVEPSPIAVAIPIEDSTMPSANQNSATTGASMLAELEALITDLSGTELTDAEPEASFLELGFDSLFLTQLTQGIQAKFRVKLTFRQIMESYPTLESLAAHLEATVAPQFRAAPIAAVADAAPSTIQGAPAGAIGQPNPFAAMSIDPGTATPGSVEALFASQMQAMTALFQRQMDALREQANAAQPDSSRTLAAPATASVIRPTPFATAAVTNAAAASDSKPAKPVFTPFKPLQRGAAGGLTPVQDQYLHKFIRDYSERSATSKEYTQSHRGVFADGRVVSGFNAQIKEMIYPLVVDLASGAYLWDKDGNRYIDILNGYGAILYGHSPDFIVDAVRSQLERGFPIGPQTELAGECAELVRELTGMERTTFCNTGSEAVMGAMRLARTVTGRNLIVLFSGDYHGSFDEVLVKSVGKGRSMPVAPGIPRESVANILVLDYGTDESLEIIRQRADELAAVLVEPVQSRHPELQPVEFLKEVRKITEQSGTALIFDEVVTGFRTHPGGMQAIYGIRADLATYGKVVAGGLPVGILSGSSTYMDALDGGQWQYGDDSFPQVGVTFYAGTFMRHPLAMAAVKASLQHIKNSGLELQQGLNAKTGALVADLKSMFAEFGYPSAVESYSSWFYFGVPQEPRLARLLHFHLREQGIHIQEGFPCFLTTAHTEEDLQFVRAAFRTSLEQMRAGDALPSAEVVSEAAAHPVPQPAAKSAASGPAVKAPAVKAPAVAVFEDAVEERPATNPLFKAPTDELPERATFKLPATNAPLTEYPMTEQQREVFFGTQLGDEANCAFNESTSLTLNGKLDDEAMIAALEAVVERHDALRASFDANGETVHVAASIPLPLERVDLSQFAPEERESEHQALLAQ
jgi:glutamate-1-semialdehyde aminotransferase/acyl carrier protein